MGGASLVMARRFRRETPGVSYHSEFWVALTAAAPVIALAHVVTVGRTPRAISSMVDDVQPMLDAQRQALDEAEQESDAVIRAADAVKREADEVVSRADDLILADLRGVVRRFASEPDS